MGAPGSGKSTLARALGCTLGWPLIDKDDVRDLLTDATPYASCCKA
jgi:adenylate kinase family enzyme